VRLEIDLVRPGVFMDDLRDFRFPGWGVPGVPPRNFLKPCLLLLLRGWSAYGYQLMPKLALFGFRFQNAEGKPDYGTVYRALRDLEREGMVRSSWDTTTEGPARRVYGLTEAGEAFLQSWINGLEQYKQALDFFFRLYSETMIPRMPQRQDEGAGRAEDEEERQGSADSGASASAEEPAQSGH
jgi:PadR family transcriptional regulator PadR